MAEKKGEFVRVAQEEPILNDEETGDFSERIGTSERRKGNAWLLFRLTICMLGIGYAWAAQFSRGASLFEDMGLSDTGVSLAFLAGPICGLLVQPIIGTLSDQYSSKRCGRRRPWIAGGLVLVVTSFLLIGDAYAIGRWLGDTHKNTRPRALVIAVSAFWVLDFAQNAVQLPCRTLVSDVLVSEDVAAGNAMFAFFDGIGKLVSYLLGAVSLEILARPNEPSFVIDARAQFAIAALVVFVCVGITLASVSEPAGQAPPAVGRTAMQAAVHAWTLAYRVMVTSQEKSSTSKEYELVALADDTHNENSARAIQAATDAKYSEWTESVVETTPATSLFDDDDEALARLRARENELIRATSSTTEERKEEEEDDEFIAGKTSNTKAPVNMETLRRICLIELGLWFGLSAWQVWGALLVSKEICNGAPAAEATSNAEIGRFQAGVMLFSLGNAGANLVSLMLSPFYPRFLRTLGARFLFLFCALFMTVTMAALAAIPFVLTHTSYLKYTNFDHAYALLEDRDPRFLLTVLFLTALGLPWSAHMNIPFSVVGRAYQDAPDVGLYMATLNSSLCVAQLAMSFSTPILLRFTQDHVSICFLAGSLAGLFSAYHANKLKVPYDESDAALRSSSPAASETDESTED